MQTSVVTSPAQKAFSPETIAIASAGRKSKKPLHMPSIATYLNFSITITPSLFFRYCFQKLFHIFRHNRTSYQNTNLISAWSGTRSQCLDTLQKGALYRAHRIFIMSSCTALHKKQNLPQWVWWVHGEFKRLHRTMRAKVDLHGHRAHMDRSANCYIIYTIFSAFCQESLYPTALYEING